MSQSVATLIESWEQRGVHLYEEAGKLKYYCEKPTLPEDIRHSVSREKTRLLSYLAQPDPLAANLSGLRQAYWLGEHSAFTQGSAAYLHLVYAGDLPSQAQLESVLEQMLALHPILNYTLDAHAPRLKPMARQAVVVEQVTAAAGQAPRRCAALPGSDTPIPALTLERPLFRLVIVESADERCLHVVYRLALFDAPSVQIFIADLMALVACGTGAQSTAGMYASARIAAQVRAGRLARFKARNYWAQKITKLAGGPDLPRLRRSTVEPKGPAGIGRFTEHRGLLAAEAYNALAERARRHRLSLNAVLLTVYLQTLARWSGKATVTCSVMYSTRPGLAKEFARHIGNFADTVLIDLPTGPRAFSAIVQHLQQDLYAAMQHGAYDGVSAVREWIKLHDQRASSAEPPMPYVFSSLLEMDLPAVPLEQTDHAMMTPQIWIDAQTFSHKGELWLSWDEREGVFSPGVIAQAFEHFHATLQRLATEPGEWDDAQVSLSPALLATVDAFNHTQQAFDSGALYQGLLHQAVQRPDAPAILDAQGGLSFAQLLCQASRLASHLNENGVGPSDHVVIRGSHDAANVIAIYATLMAGATYVPVSKHSPRGRVHSMINQAAATTVLGDDDADIAGILTSPVNWYLNYRQWLEAGHGQGACIMPAYPAVDSSLAYIMFTSGTTGVPKGVSVTHRAALNTLQDCRKRFAIDDSDRLLGVSEFSFDLSVFDLFMPALSGCALVLGHGAESADPNAWLVAAREHRVSIWNSVPAIMEMALSYALATQLPAPAPAVRLWMASGDWINLSLPDRLRASAPGSRFVALGGATEAAIWSNCFEVEQVDPQWPSIPYGRPLANQRFYILDALGRRCPPEVKGMLHIAGEGLAVGYIHDRQRTEQAFFEDPGLCQRVYRTGDLGRLRMDGEMEFLGREDLQVKLNGFRVELGEIDAVFRRAPGVLHAAACLGETEGLLVAVVLDPGFEPAPSAQQLLAFGAHYLNPYMVPARIVELGQLPLTANGKVDRQQLTKQVVQRCGESSSEPQDLGFCAKQQLMANCVQRVLPAAVDPQRSWFDLGASSLHAVHILQALNTQMGLELNLADIYSYPSVSRLQAYLQDRSKGARNLVHFRRDKVRDVPLLVLVHPVGGALSCYLPLVEALGGRFDIVGICADSEQHFASINAQALAYFEQLREPLAEYRQVVLAGWSYGGVVAVEIARLLSAGGQHLPALVTIDAGAAQGEVLELPPTLLQQMFQHDLMHTEQIQAEGEVQEAQLNQALEQRFALFCRHYAALLNYCYQPVACPTWHLHASEQRHASGLHRLSELSTQEACVRIVANHYSILSDAALEQVILYLERAAQHAARPGEP